MDNPIEKNIDVTVLLRALKRFWLLIAITGVLGAVSGVLLATFVVQPLYRSTALIFAWADIEKPIINSPAAKNGNANGSSAQEGKNEEISFRMAQELATAKLRGFQLLSQQLTVGNLLMPDFEALLNSRKLRQKIDEKLIQLYPEKAGIAFAISVAPLPKTRFVEVSVTCHDAAMTPEIVNVVVTIFAEEARSLLGISNTQIIDTAQSAIKISPRRGVYTMGGLLLGLGFGFLVGFLIDFTDKSIRDIRELETSFKLPVLGVLPEVTSGNTIELWSQDTKSTYGEAVRSVRVNVEYLLPETGRAKIFLVSSASKGDGKSSIMSSLAVSIAQIEKRVLLVDVDLRRPRQHRVFKISNKAGLADMLVSKIKFEDLVQRDVKVPGLDVLPSGTIPMNPTDLIGSRRLEDFLREQSQNYDYILLDAPPTMGFADPMILGNLADSTIITCDYRHTNTDKLRVCIDRLRKSNVRLGGLVLNRFQLQNRSDYYYNYQHYYYQYQYMPDNERHDEVVENDPQPNS